MQRCVLKLIDHPKKRQGLIKYNGDELEKNVLRWIKKKKKIPVARMNYCSSSWSLIDIGEERYCFESEI